MENLDLMKRTLLKYKNLLCDMSRRNKELYFKGSSTALALSKLTMSKETVEREKYEELFSPIKLNTDALKTLMTKRSLSLTDFFHLKKFINPTLEKTIDKVRQNDNKYQKEFGISGGWFLGPFLLWKIKEPKHKDEIIISPIFKLPIDINKIKGKKFSLILEEEEIFVNPTLKLYLEREYAIKLPEKYETSSVEEALEKVMSLIKEKEIEITINSTYNELVSIPPRQKSIRDENGDIIGKEDVILEEALNEKELEFYRKTNSKHFFIHDIFFVDHINASKLALYNDYDKIMEGFNHELITELLAGAKVPTKSDKSKIKELDKYCEKENYFVVDIDSTQHFAIDIAKNNRAIVIQGPPGTGKSQTITNLVSQLLAENKKVLFISEKRAALDVVYQRLKSSELDKQSIIIHSSDLNRKEFFQSFIDLINEEYEHSVSDNWENTANELNSYKQKVNQYVEALQGIDNYSGLEKIDLFSLYSKYQKDELNIEISDYLLHMNYDGMNRFTTSLSELIILKDKIPNYPTNKWLEKNVGYIVTERIKIELSELFETINKLIQGISNHKDENLSIFPNSNIHTDLEELPEYISHDNKLVLSLLCKFKGLQKDFENFTTKVSKSIEEMKSSIQSHAHFSHDSDFNSMVVLSSYYSTPKGFFDWFTPTFWKMRKNLKYFLIDKSFKVNANKEIKQWITFKESMKSVNTSFSNQMISNEYTGILSEDELSNLDNEITSSNKLIKNLNLLGGERVSADYDKASFNKLIQDQEKVYKNNATIKDLMEELQLNISKLEKLTGFDFPELQESDLSPVSALLEEVKNDSQYINDLDNTQLKILEIEEKFSLPNFKSFLLKHLISYPNLEELIECQLVKGWYDKLLGDNPHLQQFNSNLHNDNLEKYKEHLNAHQNLAKKIVNNKLAKQREGTNSISELGLRLIQKEAKKTRSIKAPREVMEAGALQTMLSMKRCWLMSPLSISQIMPNEMNLFDVVIFDEASQVRVEDAIPSIYRGSSLIVVGDNKQMPPTNFFSGSGVDEDFDDEEYIELGESVLDQALKSYPDVLLEWHYRSQAEALIAFSNYAFYGGRLIAPPNPSTLVKNRPIVFEKVQDGVFNSRTGNPTEAKAIVEEIIEILTKDFRASIGIISMGVSQQKAIEVLLDEAAAINPNFAEAYDKAMNHTEEGAFVGFFNKNLENVQGDERDYIIISCGYAPNKLGGKLRQAFGPLSSQGGGRRLNVAITRAKKKIKVYCSFEPSELDMSDEAFSKNPEKTCFARYLNYAKAVSNEKLDSAINILNMFSPSGPATQRKPSRFNLDVKREIEKLGYKVTTEVGSCGFYIDLGVEHPNVESTYLLGIECDGAIFHSSPYARDRDKTRQGLLEARGWKIHRIWSQDWSKSREDEILKIKTLLEKLSPSS